MFPIVRRRRGFTLIELLLVIAIIGVVTAVSVPTFVRSMRGNRLRAAARTVVMAGRYAHSMCLLNQKELDLRFDLTSSTISVVPVGAGGSSAAAPAVPPGAGRAEPVSAPTADATPEGAGESSGGAGATVVERKLDEVRIAYVRIGDEDAPAAHEAEQPVVRYRSNGSCTPYTVRIEDDEGAGVTIYVDMLGGAETEQD